MLMLMQETEKGFIVNKKRLLLRRKKDNYTQIAAHLLS